MICPECGFEQTREARCMSVPSVIVGPAGAPPWACRRRSRRRLRLGQPRSSSRLSWPAASAVYQGPSPRRGVRTPVLVITRGLRSILSDAFLIFPEHHPSRS